MGELSRQILEEIANASAEAIIVIGATSTAFRIDYVNPAYEELTGYPSREALGRSWALLDSNGDDTPEIAALKAALGRAEPYVGMLADVRKDGTSWLSRIRVQPVFNRRGELRQYLIMQSEAAVTEQRHDGAQLGLLQRELRRARQKAASLDRVDPASGLLRYEYFVELADRDCRVARRDQKLAGVAVFEINDFDIYRQTFGAKAADSCIRMIGAQVTRALRRAGDLCGCDDDKRIVAFTLGQGTAELEQIAERVTTNVRRLGLHNPRGRRGRHITVNAAVAACTPSGNDAFAELMDEAQNKLEGAVSEARGRRSARA